MKAVAIELGEDMTDEELQEMIAGGNKGDKDGSVSQSGFFNILNKSNTWPSRFIITYKIQTRSNNK